MNRRANREFDLEDLKGVFISLGVESDRGAVLISSCFLDGQLESLHKTYIQAKIGTSAKLASALFSYPHPLSTFAARIQLAYAYGLIGSEIYNELEKIRRIRNDCAHSFRDFSFSDASIKTQALSLRFGHTAILARIPEIRPALDAVEERFRTTGISYKTDARLHFLFSCQEAGFRILEMKTKILKAEIARYQKKT
jgi:hypothetical protein